MTFLLWFGPCRVRVLSGYTIPRCQHHDFGCWIRLYRDCRYVCEDRLESNLISANKCFVLVDTSNCCGTVWLFANCPVHRYFPSTCHPVSEYLFPWLGVHICLKFGGDLALKEMIYFKVDFASWHNIYWECRRNLTSFRDEIKVKCTPVQALGLCTGCTAHRESRGIALLFHGQR